MTRRPHPLLAALLAAAGMLISGCGGGGASSTPTTTVNPGGSSSTPTATATSSSTTAGETTAPGNSSSTTSTTSAPSPATPSQNLPALVAVCRREVASAGVLTAAERLQLDNVCSVAATGDRARLRAAERQVCLTVLRDSTPGLRGPAVRAAAQSCNRL